MHTRDERGECPPSVTAARNCDEQVSASDREAGSSRQQIAIVRALADELERCLLRGGDPESVREQLTQELARLGSEDLDTAEARTESAPGADARGVPTVAAVLERCRRLGGGP